MKKRRNKISRGAIVILFGIIAFVACNKNESTLTTREKQLSVREWKITDITRPRISNPSQDSSIMKSCTVDDRVLFNSNKTYQLKDNVTKCDSTVFAYDNGNWVFNSSQDQLQLSGSRRSQKWNILILNDSILKVQWRDSISVTNNVLKTITFKNK